MSGSTQDELSPWVSGSWHFNPKEVGVISRPRPARSLSRPAWEKSRKSPSKKVKRRPLREHDILRLASIALFAFSGFVFAVLAMLLIL